MTKEVRNLKPMTSNVKICRHPLQEKKTGRRERGGAALSGRERAGSPAGSETDTRAGRTNVKLSGANNLDILDYSRLF